LQQVRIVLPPTLPRGEHAGEQAAVGAELDKLFTAFPKMNKLYCIEEFVKLFCSSSSRKEQLQLSHAFMAPEFSGIKQCVEAHFLKPEEGEEAFYAAVEKATSISDVLKALSCRQLGLPVSCLDSKRLPSVLPASPVDRRKRVP
jgi:hypothetical protein